MFMPSQAVAQSRVYGEYHTKVDRWQQITNPKNIRKTTYTMLWCYRLRGYTQNSLRNQQHMQLTMRAYGYRWFSTEQIGRRLVTQSWVCP